MSYSMPVRSKVTHSALRRRRTNWVNADRRATDSAIAQPDWNHAPAERSHRQGGATQDRALYSCSCGYAFDAHVSTSVDCPHCGDRQAW